MGNERSDTEMNYIAEEQQFAQAPCDVYDDETFSFTSLFNLWSDYKPLGPKWGQLLRDYSSKHKYRFRVIH